MELKISSAKDFGDFQTPKALIEKILRCLGPIGKRFPHVLEPTCGRGNFIEVLLSTTVPPKEIVGLELQNSYYHEARKLRVRSRSTKVTITKGSIFDQDINSILPWKKNGAGLLVVGNPPWVTNSALGSSGSNNLPRKENFKNRRGLDAITGGSNFDITEYIWLKLIRELSPHKPTIALLCKTSVARNVLEYASQAKLPLSNARIYKIDAKEWFQTAVDACLFFVKVGGKTPDYRASVYADLLDKKPQSIISVVGGMLVSNTESYSRSGFIEGDCPLVWRQGLKHDAAKVMELVPLAPKGNFLNGVGEVIEVENSYIYPLAKSSDLYNQRYSPPGRGVIVTQKRLNDDTRQLANRAPKLWDYLSAHADVFARRKSSIYTGKSPFSMFGIGDYSFSPYKVAISGLYKNPKFRAVGLVNGRPVMLDDTCYFIPCSNPESAALVTALLNDPSCLEFLDSTMFRDSKRPITKKLLKRINLNALLNHINKRELLHRAEEYFLEFGLGSPSWPSSLEVLLATANHEPTQLNLVA